MLHLSGPWLTDRLYAIGTRRIRSLREIDENDVARAWLGELTQRERLLNSALHLSVLAGIGVTVLLLFGFGRLHEIPPRTGSRRSVDGRLSVPEASLFRLLQDFRPLQSEHDVHRQGDKPVLLLPAAALEVEGYTYNWALLDDVEDKPVVLVVDAQRPVSGDCRDGVVELITETEANIPVDVGAATAHQSPSR